MSLCFLCKLGSYLPQETDPQLAVYLDFSWLFQMWIMHVVDYDYFELYLLLQGSFGTVYKGAWHGKAVAVKIMHFPANALLNVEDASSASGAQQCRPTAASTCALWPGA